MSENNDSGNRWEKKADAESVEATAEVPDPMPATELPKPPAASTEPAAEPAAAPVPAPSSSRLPGWVTGRGLAAAGAAAAIFLGGGGIGYAIGAAGGEDGQQFPGRFDRAGFQPGQGPGGRIPDGDGQGRGFQQGPQSQSPGQSSDGGSSGTDSGTDSGTTTS